MNRKRREGGKGGGGEEADDFCGAIKYFKHTLMGHEKLLNNFDGSQKIN